MAPNTFWDWVQKQESNLDYQRIFDNPRGKYLISKEFHECNNYISSYIPMLG